MRMREMRLMLLMMLCLLLSGCAADPLLPMATEGTADIPAPVVEDLPASQTQAVLWFRYGEEPLLAPETRQLSVPRTESEALTLLQALLEGPSAASTELTSVFPQGTRVLSLTQSGQVMFVTMSRHIMNRFADEPEDWRDQPAWAVEVPMRRQLAMQSIAATLTENCAVDRVVILVEDQQTSTDSLRLRKGYYTLEEDDDTLAEPLQRDESLLLTPARTAEVILECWQQSDWARLYRYLARTDAATGMDRPDEGAFAEMMASLPRLLHAQPHGGSLAADRAVFTVDGAWLDSGVEQAFSGRVLRLTRERGLWRVGLSQLTGMEAQP